jgi:hypothetical protein
VHPYAHPPKEKILKHLEFVLEICVGCSLKGSTASTIALWHHLNIYIAHIFKQQLFQIWGYACGSNHVSVHLYAHPPQEKVLKYLKLVSDGCGMQCERFSSLNQSIVASFVNIHPPTISANSPKSGKTVVMVEMV